MAQFAQLKSSAIVFDSDDPTSSWDKSAKLIEAWVGSLAGGLELIDLLDCLLERPIGQRNSALIPSFLLGDAWSTDDDSSGELSNDDESSPLKRRGAASGLIAPATNPSPLYKVRAWRELSQESRALDAALYPYLCSMILGSKRVLLDNLGRPLFTQGLMSLHKHFQADCCTKLTAAFAEGQLLRFSGDTKEYQIQVFSFIDSLLSSKATITHYILACIMQSDLPSAVKYGIAQDLNEGNIEEMNIYDLVSSYCADISAVSGSSTNPIVLAALPTTAVCHRCGKGGHKADICWVNIHANGSRLDSSTITAKAKDMKHKKFSKNNKIDVTRMSRDDREQLMANLTIAELENKGKIGN